MENLLSTDVPLGRHPVSAEALGQPRNFLDNKYVYVVISSRAKGLSVGVNINPAAHCSFDCLYCEVDHTTALTETRCDLDLLAAELQNTLTTVRSGAIRHHPPFRKMPAELLELRHVAISGNGEPTLCRDFADAVNTIMHLRARSREFYKVVLITNGTGLHLPGVQEGLRYFTSEDEIWIKLDAGTPEFISKINRSQVPFERIISNIVQLAARRPVTIQSLFPSIDGEEPPAAEIQAYATRLAEMKKAGAQINLVQIYSADRPSQKTGCGHLPLKTLCSIARTVRQTSGLKAEVF